MERLILINSNQSSIAEQEKSNAAVFVGTTANPDFTVKL
ncbi:hypothetical protein LEP1GSC059_0389 [Leptospira noguchii serovar Panama str. CZ214]|uniref:Uncharacterized protein n=1 Tax=Leptospira noguchii serovar Panama str. CZ214 TaxID=1001595 RepID=T0FTH6_9LEPT|nr:hypothetical protein LEP1GSC059_0389 [Leptospira noguchii serovar Panama str. CZ214]